MLYVCERCGAWSDQVLVEGDEHHCPECDHRRRFLRLPLFCVSGASGAGKTTVRTHVQAAASNRVVLDSDVLWRNDYRESPDALTEYRRTWLRLAMNISRAGRPLVLLGTVLPEHYESQPERRLFSVIHYLALVCSDDELKRRLRARPLWRGYDEEKIERMLVFNQWLRQHASATSPPMRTHDTTNEPVEKTASAVATWAQAAHTCDTQLEETRPPGI